MNFNVTIYDNGAAFLIRVNGLTVAHFNTLGDAWKHIIWMHRIECQTFTVGASKTPAKEWCEGLRKMGYLD